MSFWRQALWGGGGWVSWDGESQKAVLLTVVVNYSLTALTVVIYTPLHVS